MSGDLKERIERMLAGLGDTADAVADSLRAKGIRGVRMEGDVCPIATLIRAEIPETEEAGWGWGLSDRETYGPKGFYIDGTWTYTPDGELRHPQPVSEFIAAFDENEYPDMAEEAG